MIICICRGASDRDVRTAIDGGANCLGRLQQCGIGGDCGMCEGMLEELVEQAVDDGRVARCRTCCAGAQAV